MTVLVDFSFKKQTKETFSASLKSFAKVVNCSPWKHFFTTLFFHTHNLRPVGSFVMILLPEDSKLSNPLQRLISFSIQLKRQKNVKGCHAFQYIRHACVCALSSLAELSQQDCMFSLWRSDQLVSFRSSLLTIEHRPSTKPGQVLLMHVSMCVYTYIDMRVFVMYLCVYIYLHRHVCILVMYLCAYIYTYIGMCVYLSCIYVCICAYIDMCVYLSCIYMCRYTYIDMWVYLLCIYVYIYIHRHVCILIMYLCV